MLGRLLRPRPHTAAAVLRRVFGRVPASFAFRLWDGTEVRFGSDRAVCVVAIKSQEIFVALMRDPSPGHFAEAYASGAIDLEGDLYKTMHVANAVEGIKLSAGEKLRIAVAMLRGVSAVMGGHDAIVVGGGPGGSTAAWQLAQAGLRPLVLDAAVFPRVKLCAGWVTAAALADVEIDPEKYPLTIQPFSVCAVAFEGARHETRWRRPASFGIIRREFDHYLLERAAAAGADVRWGVRVQAVTADAGGAAVETEQGRFEAPLVIGAGGHRCPVARDLGEISGREEVVVAQESETRLPPERVASLGRFMDAPELYVEPDLRGYGWYFPKQDFLNIGIGCTGGADAGLRERRDALVAALRASGRLPADLPLEPFKGHAYVVRRQAPRRLVGPRFCLVGDAAGLARDLSGEGIGPAIRSGRLAAAAVRALLRDGTSLAGYAREIVALYGPGEPGWLARQIGKLPDAVARAAVRVILGSGAARRRVVFGSIFGMREAAS